ncbi:sulfite exporter TauE/SafE family protein [Abyssalbus ytuae]|uniref:Probable membrane transporter protein n=1 Tax=Abyssalbus ytuae TaxID=2926907 RepID=A0A9E7A102_9FLAO|nr:sulfite exporter TauE/SafE family protein [Abyssalbus ytuae]UOB17766.1 sulfite exporter TauE/SafE family protein [Abyssalbus ytuae]
MNSASETILLISIGFVTGIINTIAGGGSLITLPILIFLGLPPDVANATNRIPIFFQTLASIAGFRSKGLKPTGFSWYLGVVSLAGAAVGAHIAIDIKGEVFNRILAVVMVIVVAFMTLNRKTGSLNIPERTEGKYFWWSMIIFFFLGIYGGFIQAGSGIFILLALSGINKISLVKSNLTKAIVVLAFTISSLILFGTNGLLNLKIGFLMAIGNIAGAWISSRWSVKKGDSLVKIFLVIMVVAMAIKLWFFNR